MFCFSHTETYLNVTGNNVSAEAIKVYWNPISLEIQGYAVRYWAEKRGEGTAVEKNVSKTTNSLLIDSLKPFTVYVVQVSALMTEKVIKGQAKISTDEGGMQLYAPLVKELKIGPQWVHVHSTAN